MLSLCHIGVGWGLAQGYSSQKSINFLLNPFCIKLVTFHFSASNFAIVHLYKEIKFKPTAECRIIPAFSQADE